MPSVTIQHRLDLDPELPEHFRKISEENGEVESTKAQIIEEFRQHILEKDRCQPHRTDDEYLVRFLRVRYWNIEASYKLMYLYYKFREQNKSYYEKVRPLELKMVGDEGIVNVTPYRDQNGHRIMIFRFGIWKPSKVTVDDIFRSVIVVQEMGALEPISQVMGGVVIFDLKDLSLNHVLHMSPSVAQKIIALLVTSMPMRCTSVHIVNQNWVFNAAFKFFKPFLDSSMQEGLHFHGTDMSSLHKHIEPDYLPERYGGIHPDYDYNLWLDNLPNQSQIQKELEQLGYIFQ